MAELIGRSFFDVSDLRRRNILEIVGPAISPLLEDWDIFEVSEGRDLFGSSVMKRLSKSGRFVRELVDLDVGGQRKGKLPARERLSSPLPSASRAVTKVGRLATAMAEPETAEMTTVANGNQILVIPGTA